MWISSHRLINRWLFLLSNFLGEYMPYPETQLPTYQGQILRQYVNFIRIYIHISVLDVYLLENCKKGYSPFLIGKIVIDLAIINHRSFQILACIE